MLNLWSRLYCVQDDSVGIETAALLVSYFRSFLSRYQGNGGKRWQTLSEELKNSRQKHSYEYNSSCMPNEAKMTDKCRAKDRQGRRK